jgi:putative oxidoreductase
MLAYLFYTNPDWIETLIRITLGVIFFAHGAQKLLGWFGGAGLKDTMRTMHQFLRLPIPLAFLAIATEFFGGAALIVGLLSRLAAFGIAVTMVVAILMVNGRYGLFLNWFGDRKGHGFEYHLLVIALRQSS